MKVVYCIIDCSQSGGMERIISCKANYLADRLGYDVTILTTDQGQKPNFYAFSDKIKFIDLGINYAALKQYSFAKRLAEQIKKRKKHRRKLSDVLREIKADIVISTYTHEFTLLPTIHDGSKKIAEIHFSKEHNKISNQSKKQSFLSKWFSGLAEKRKYRFIDKYSKFVILTKNNQIYWKNHANIAQIYNMLPFQTDEPATLDEKRIISAGRLSQEKGFDRLIEAFSLVNKDFPDWRLDIFGSGEDERKLRKQIEQYQIEKRIIIHAPIQDVIKEYLNSSIYVMSSYHEGFPMVLLEAMACGLPCVAFDCPHGPSEIIRDGEDGFLVENGNVDLLAEKIKALIADAKLRKKMGKKAKQNVQRFSPDNIMHDWNVLFKSTIHENPANQ
jgi:glycosyltransferase involved in cell wall biosynthesis